MRLLQLSSNAIGSQKSHVYGGLSQPHYSIKMPLLCGSSEVYDIFYISSCITSSPGQGFELACLICHTDSVYNASIKIHNNGKLLIPPKLCLEFFLPILHMPKKKMLAGILTKHNLGNHLMNLSVGPVGSF